MQSDSAFHKFQETHGLEELKKIYEREMETQLGELGIRMQEWARRSDSMDTNGAQDLKALRQWQINAMKKLHELRHVDEDDWSEQKNILDETWESLQAAWREFKDESNEFKRQKNGRSTTERRTFGSFR